MSAPPSIWNSPYADHPVVGVVSVPGSKSLMARAVVLAALSDGPSVIRGALRARDTLLMAQAIRSLGATIDDSGDTWQITPGFGAADLDIDCGLSGTVMRFVPPLAGLATGTIGFDGDPHARSRPMGELLDGLRQAGVQIDDQGRDGLPFAITATGTIRGGLVQIDASQSSQFVTGLLLAGARFEQGLRLVHVGAKVPSRPHIAMTVANLRERGVHVDDSVRDEWTVAPSAIAARDVVLEPDLSNAAPFLAAALVSGGSVTVTDWPTTTDQPGDQLRHIFAMMGARVASSGGQVTVTAGDLLNGIDADLSEVGELTPVIAAVCALASSPSKLRGVGHLRGHETDRLAALEHELNALGGDVVATSDELLITPQPLHSGVFSTYDDHRLAHAGAVLGLAVRGVQVENIETTAKTMPQFARLWTNLVAGAETAAPNVAEMSR